MARSLEITLEPGAISSGCIAADSDPPPPESSKGQEAEVTG